MPLLYALVGSFLLKALFLLPFYFRVWKPMLGVALLTVMAVIPLITILYHETALDFWYVYAGMIGLDVFLYLFFLQRNWWKVIPASFLANTFVIIYFYIGNG